MSRVNHTIGRKKINKVQIIYRGWLSDALNKGIDKVNKPNSEVDVIGDIFSQLHLISKYHKKYLDRDFIRIYVDGEIINNYEKINIPNKIVMMAPTFD